MECCIPLRIFRPSHPKSPCAHSLPRPVPQHQSPVICLNEGEMGAYYYYCYSVWILALLAGAVVSVLCSLDWQALVYHDCSKEEYPAGSTFQSNLNAMLESIISEVSPRMYYYHTSAGDGDSAVYGLVQCRGDLGNAECSYCMKNVVARAPALCGKSQGAQIQLQGCYLRYNDSMFFGDPDTGLVHRTCSPLTTTDPGFFSRREGAFAGLVQGSFNENNYCVSTSGDSRIGVVYGFAQCEGDLSTPDCAACILEAIQILKDACGRSVAGEIYLQKCYVSYAKDMSFPKRKSGVSHEAAKTAAITIGILAAVGFAFVLFFFLKSLWRKNG